MISGVLHLPEASSEHQTKSGRGRLASKQTASSLIENRKCFYSF